MKEQDKNSHPHPLQQEATHRPQTRPCLYLLSASLNGCCVEPKSSSWNSCLLPRLCTTQKCRRSLETSPSSLTSQATQMSSESGKTRPN